MDFGERNSPCQLSVPSADKSRCVIAARVVPANEGTAARAGGRRAEQPGHRPPEPPACLASLQHRLSKCDGEPGLELCVPHHPLCPPPPARPRGWLPPLLPSRELWMGSGPSAPLQGVRSRASPPSYSCISAPSSLEQDGRGRKRIKLFQTGLASETGCFWVQALG